jgi:hypothetical protein
MSQAGPFHILTLDDRYDKYFTASEFLHKRLYDIAIERKARGGKPSITDIEQTHIFYMHGIYRPFVAVACEYMHVKHSGGNNVLGSGGNIIEFKFPNYGHFTSDIVFHVKFADVGSVSQINNVSNTNPRYYFTNYPGIRLFRRVSFCSSEYTIDDYTSDDVNFINKFEIGADQRVGWDRSMGQQELRCAEYSSIQGHTGVFFYKEGMQSANLFHGGNHLWIPGHFWFCKDASQALLNGFLPNSQRIIKVELAALNEIIQSCDRDGNSIPLPINKLNMQIELYVNNIWINSEVYDVLSAHVGFSLIRVHRRQVKILNSAQNLVLMDQLKYPTEFMYIGIRDLANAKSFLHWNLFGRALVRSDNNRLLAPAMHWNINSWELVCRAATEVTTLEPIVESITITAHGIDLYPPLPVSFFNSYLPQRFFHNTGIVCADDSSAMLISFCLYPGMFNPSGYYNLSTARELYICYSSTKINPFTPAELIVSVSSPNFLIRNGDKCELRYAL